LQVSVSYFLELQHTLKDKKVKRGFLSSEHRFPHPVSATLFSLLLQATTSQLTVHCPSSPTWCSHTCSMATCATWTRLTEQIRPGQNKTCAAISSAAEEAPNRSTPQTFALLQEMGQQWEQIGQNRTELVQPHGIRHAFQIGIWDACYWKSFQAPVSQLVGLQASLSKATLNSVALQCHHPLTQEQQRL